MNFTRAISTLLMLVMVLGLQACGGGGGGGGGGSVVGPTQSAAAGYYDAGTLTDKNATVTNNLLGIVNYDRFMFMSSTVLYDATMNVSGTTFTANLVIYKNGINPITTATATGSFVANTSISIDIKDSGDNTIDGSVTFNFSPNNTYNGSSNVTKIENYYWATSAGPISNFTTSNVSPGSISAITNRAGDFFVGCVLDTALSKFTAIPATNLYNVTIVVDTCTNSAARGTYKGLASTQKGAVNDDTMFFAITNTNNQFSISTQFER